MIRRNVVRQCRRFGENDFPFLQVEARDICLQNNTVSKNVKHNNNNNNNNNIY